MAEERNAQQVQQNKIHGMQKQMDGKKLQPSTFAEPIFSKRTPIAKAQTKPLEEVTGNTFKLISSTTETAQDTDKDGNRQDVDRAVYTVQPLNSKVLPVNQELTIKIKGSQSVLTEEMQMDLLYNTKIYLATFDEISHWTFSGTEGLNATDVHIVGVTPQEFRKMIGELRHE